MQGWVSSPLHTILFIKPSKKQACFLRTGHWTAGPLPCFGQPEAQTQPLPPPNDREAEGLMEGPFRQVAVQVVRAGHPLAVQGHNPAPAFLQVRVKFRPVPPDDGEEV